MPERIQLRRTKGWRLPEGARVVTRSTIFGNPWAVGTDEAFWWPQDPRGPRWISTHRIPAGRLTAEEAVERFRWFMEGHVASADAPVQLTPAGRRSLRDAMVLRRSTILQALPSLRGRDLACWCKPGCHCHADVLIEMANR